MKAGCAGRGRGPNTTDPNTPGGRHHRWLPFVLVCSDGSTWQDPKYAQISQRMPVTVQTSAVRRGWRGWLAGQAA